MKNLFLIFVLFLATNESHARLIRGDYLGVRALGMGGALLAVADDNDALWYNPAGLANVKGSHLSVVDLQNGFDGDTTFFRMVTALSGDTSNLVKLDGPQFMRVAIRPTFIKKYFAFSLYENLTGFSNLRDIQSLNLTADIFYRNDLGAIAGFAFPMGDSLSIGISGRLFLRATIDANMTVANLLDVVDSPDPDAFSSAAAQYLTSLMGVGYAFSASAGFQWRIPLGISNPQITLAGTIDDIGSTTFTGYGGYPTPSIVYQTLNAGANIRWLLGNKQNQELNVMADYRDLLSTTPYWQRLMLGGEYKWGRLGLRAGIHQGYWTAGVSLRIAPHTVVDICSFAVELQDAVWTHAHRWYQVQLKLGFNPL